MFNIVEMSNLAVLFAYTVICMFGLVFILMSAINTHHRQANGVCDSVVAIRRRELILLQKERLEFTICLLYIYSRRMIYV